MIEVTNIMKKYKKKEVLKGVSFSANKGECIGIIGANGSGKSTLLAILAGAGKADSGSIYFNQQEAIGNSKLYSEYIGYVPQENPIIEELTVKDNLTLWCTYAGIKYEDLKKHGSIDFLDLDSVINMTAGKLSGGMKKRLSIAFALCNKQPILVMDEPSAALDLVCKADIYNYMKYYINEGGTILISTHDEAELALCDRLFLLKHGKLKEVSTGVSTVDLVREFTNS